MTGVSEIADTLISIYNAEGIKVGANFDRRLRYTYELAIPLKYLQAGIADLKSLRYNVKLRTMPIIMEKPVARPAGPVLVLKYAGPSSLNDEFLYNDSDFSGIYTLALKP